MVQLHVAVEVLEISNFIIGCADLHEETLDAPAPPLSQGAGGLGTLLHRAEGLVRARKSGSGSRSGYYCELLASSRKCGGAF